MSDIRHLRSWFHARERLGAFLFFACVVAIVYAPVVFFGKSLQSPSHHPNTVLPQGAYGYEGRRPFSAFSVDASGASFSEHPLNKIVGDMYRSGTLPLWNPYKGMGEPLPEQLGSSAFFPFQILQDISPVWLWDFFLLGRLLVAGFFSFLFLRLLMFSRAGALLGGLLYMLSGSMVWFINNEAMVNPAMMLPVVLWSLELVMQQVRPRSVAILAFSTACLFLAGPPMVIIYNALLAGCFFLFRIVFRHAADGPRNHSVGGAALGALCGLGLAAPLLLPFFEFLGHIHVLRAGTGLGSVEPMNFWLTIFPALSYFPADYRFIENGLWDRAGSTIGILPLMLITLGALCVVRARQTRKFFWFFGLFALTILLKNYGVFPATLLGKLPLLGTIWSPRWAAPAWTLGAAVAAAAGFDAIRFHGKEAWEAVAKHAASWPKLLYVGLITLGTSLIIGIGYMYYRLLDFLGAFENIRLGIEGYSWEGTVFYFGAILALLAIAVILVIRARKIKDAFPLLVLVCLAELWLFIPRGYSSLALLAAPMLSVLGLLLFLIWRQFKLAVFCVVAFAVSFATVDYFSPFGLPERSDPYAVPPYVRYLQAQPGHYRSIGTYGILMPNISGVFGLADFRHVSGAIIKEVYSFKRMLLKTDEHPFWFLDAPKPLHDVDLELFPSYCGTQLHIPRERKRSLSRQLPYYSLLGIKYFLVPRGKDMADVYDLGKDDPDFPLVYDGEVRIYENPSVLPRAFVAQASLRADSYDQAHRELAKMSPGMLRTTAVAESAPSIDPVPPADPGRALITTYDPNRVVIQVHADAPGLLVLTDAFYPGWTATVDGASATLFRADGAFRGVAVPAGRHEVVMSYWPPTLSHGLALAGAGLIALGLLMPRYPNLFPYLAVGIAVTGAIIAFSYGKGLVMYARNWSDIHADVWQGSKTPGGNENKLLDARREEARFISKNIGLLTSNFEKDVTAVDAVWFPKDRTDRILVDYQNAAGLNKRVAIDIISQGNVDGIKNVHTRNIAQYMVDDYLQRGKVGIAPSGRIPASLSGEFRSSGILDVLLFYWRQGDGSLDSKLYITRADYIRDGTTWRLRDGDHEAGPVSFNEGLSYSCDEAQWKTIPDPIPFQRR